jgi:transcriptional regulator GlxA family with amidase domain
MIHSSRPWSWLCSRPEVASHSSVLSSQHNVVNGAPSCSLHPWIADRLGDDLSVPVMAARTFMSVRNFARRFAKELGSTPVGYVEAVRVEAGRRLLDTTRRGPTDTARDCGFGTVETMHRSF